MWKDNENNIYDKLFKRKFEDKHVFQYVVNLKTNKLMKCRLECYERLSDYEYDMFPLTPSLTVGKDRFEEFSILNRVTTEWWNMDNYVENIFVKRSE